MKKGASFACTPLTLSDHVTYFPGTLKLRKVERAYHYMLRFILSWCVWIKASFLDSKQEVTSYSDC